MSILDGMPSTQSELDEVLKIAAPLVEKALAAVDFNPLQKRVIELMKQGLSLADILGISKQDRDVLFTHGCRQLQVGDVANARDTLLMLYQLEPLDARVVYALAMTYQVEGNVRTAARLYVHFLALDATNAEGYLRLGECFVAAGEHDNARDSFSIARDECARGNGNAAAAAHANKMLEQLRAPTSHLH